MAAAPFVAVVVVVGVAVGAVAVAVSPAFSAVGELPKSVLEADLGSSEFGDGFNKVVVPMDGLEAAAAAVLFILLL